MKWSNKATYMLAILPVTVTFALTGCGAQKVNTAAVSQFKEQESSHIQAVNNDFTTASTLFQQVSTQQMTYSSFKTAYQKNQVNIQQEIHAITNAKAPQGATQYQKDYVKLLNQGLQLFADQETAIRQDGSVDPTKVSKVRKELTQFQKASTQLASKYGNQ